MLGYQFALIMMYSFLPTESSKCLCDTSYAEHDETLAGSPCTDHPLRKSNRLMYCRFPKDLAVLCLCGWKSQLSSQLCSALCIQLRSQQCSRMCSQLCSQRCSQLCSQL